MSALCIITARGGSKRIPRKNIRDFLGKPIIAYSITAAIDSGIFSEVMVSTDDPEIAQVSRDYGAVIPFMRSPKTSDDYSVTRDVLLEVLGEYDKRGRNFEHFACIYPTAPFVTAEKLRHAFDILRSGDADEVTPVVQYSFPPQRAFIMRDGGLVWQYPQYMNTRSQDLEPVYHDCGQFYFYRTDTYTGRAKGTGKRLPMIISEEETQDIDNLSDWEIAEIKYSKFIRRE